MRRARACSGYVESTINRYPGIKDFIRLQHHSRQAALPQWLFKCVPGETRTALCRRASPLKRLSLSRARAHAGGVEAQQEANTIVTKALREMARAVLCCAVRCVELARTRGTNS